MDPNEESTKITCDVKPELLLKPMDDDEDDMDYYNDGSPEPKKKKENVDLFMDCEEEELSNSQLQSYKHSVEEFDNNDEFEQPRIQDSAGNLQQQQPTISSPSVAKVKREKPARKYDEDPDYSPHSENFDRYITPRIISAHSVKRKKPINTKIITSNTQQSIQIAPLNNQSGITISNKTPCVVPDSIKSLSSGESPTLAPTNIVLPQGTTLSTSTNQVIAPGTFIQTTNPPLIGPDNAPLAVKTVLVNQITGQVYGEILNPPKTLINSPIILNNQNINNNQIKTTVTTPSTKYMGRTKSSSSATSINVRNAITNLMNFQPAEELASLATVDEDDPLILCKFDPAWFERKVIFESKMIMLKELMKKIKMPGKVLCKICSEVLNYSAGGVKSIEVHCNTIRHKNNLRNHYKSLDHINAKDQANKNAKANLNNSPNQVVQPTKVPEIAYEEQEDYSSEEWKSGNLDALKLIQPQTVGGASFENLPPGVKTTTPFLQDYDKAHAKGLKHHLDVKLSSSGIFSKQPENLTEWMMDAGLLNESLSCPVCASATALIATVNSDNIDQNMWKCVKCSRTKSIRFLSFFDFHPIKLQSLLVLVYHWAFRSDTLKVFMTVQHSMPSSPRPLPILVNFWLSIRRLCSKMVNTDILTQQIGGYGKKLLIDSIVIPKGIIILATHDICSADVRFKVISPSDYKSYKETLQKWIKEGTIIYTSKENIKRSLTTKDITFHPTSELPNEVCSSLATFLNDDVSVLFGMEFFSSPIINEPADRAKMFRQKTLFNVSLKNTMKETIELMQLALDEVMWRSHFGRTEAEAFVNILKAIAIHDKSKDEGTILKRSQPTQVKKKFPPVEVTLDDDEPVITASSSNNSSKNTSKTTHVQIVSRAATSSNSQENDDVVEIIDDTRGEESVSAPVPTKEPASFPQVKLEEYYYSSYTPQGSSDFSVVTLSSPQLKCHICEKNCADNVHYMKHVLFHIDNYRNQNSDLGNLTQCKYCFRTFDTPYNMQCHMDEVHLSRDPDVQLCRICEIRFYETEKLILHMRVNHRENEMPYTCEICMYRSSFYSDVMTHFNETHRATNKLLCPYCLRVFSIVSKIFYFKHLLRHQNRKSSGQRGRCRQCCLSFILDNDLKQHVARAHSDFAIPRDQSGIVKPSLPTSTMIPHPDKVPKSKVLKMSQTANVPVKQKPKPRHISNVKGLEVNQEYIKFYCIECKRPMSQFHFSKRLWCSKCQYATFCLKSYSEHMIQNHSDQRNRRRTIIRLRYKTMYCLCQYASSDMIAMAGHLVKCRKKTCYPSKKHVGMGVFGQSATFPPLVVLDEDEPSDNSQSQPVQETVNPSTSLATGLSLSTQLAANNRTDSTTKADDAKGTNDKHSKMLSVLGLMRKTSASSKDSASDGEECEVMDRVNTKALEDDEALDRQEEEEVKCPIDISVDDAVKETTDEVEETVKTDAMESEEDELDNLPKDEKGDLPQVKQKDDLPKDEHMDDLSQSEKKDDFPQERDEQKEILSQDHQKKDLSENEQKEDLSQDHQKEEPSEDEQKEDLSQDDQKEDLCQDEQKEEPSEDEEKEDQSQDDQKEDICQDEQMDDLPPDDQKEDSVQKKNLSEDEKKDNLVQCEKGKQSVADMPPSEKKTDDPLSPEQPSGSKPCEHAAALDSIEAAIAKLRNDCAEQEVEKSNGAIETNSDNIDELSPTDEIATNKAIES